MSNTSISTSGIYGTDNETPEYDPLARATTWSAEDIYFPGGPGLNKHVPKVGDLVWYTDPLVFKKVVAIDEQTLNPELVTQSFSSENGEFTDDDILTGVGMGTPSDTYRIYVDKSVVPHSVCIDSRLTVGGSRVMSCRVFRGNNVTDAGDIISHIYDAQGNIVGDKIPLEVIAFEGNVSTKVVPPFQTMADLPDGEVVTAIMYTDTGHKASGRQLLVENTSYVRRANVFTRYITAISLKCPFLSSSDPTLINLPVNVNLTGLNLTGVIHFSDGSTDELPVDGNRFTLMGLDNFIATQPGQEIPLTLRLRLLQDETSYDTTQVNPGYMTRNFRIITTQSDGAYNVKLYCAPTWQSSTLGYRLRWFMYNLDRQTTEEVTSFVTFSPESAPFEPLSYGVSQNLVAAINLQDVNPGAKDYRHVQTVALVLRGPGTQRTTNWTLAYVNAQDPAYGVDTHANLRMINANLYEMKVDSGFTSLEQWLNKLYWAGKPLYDPLREGNAPEPNVFVVVVGGTELEFSVDQWNQQFQVGAGLALNGTAIIKFLRRTSTTDLQLGIAPMAIYELTT